MSGRKACLVSRDPIPHVGGKSTQILQMVDVLNKRGWSVEVVSPSIFPAALRVRLAAGYKFRRLFGRATARWWYERRLLRELSSMVVRRQPDVFVAHDVVAAAAIPADASMALVVHSDLANELVGGGWITTGSRAERWMTELERRAYERPGTVVTVDSRLRVHVESLSPESARRRLVVLPNAVDTARWSPGEGGKEADLVVAARRLEPKNGVEVLVRACAVSLARGASWRLLLLGDGQLRSALQALAVHLGVGAHVQFHGDASPEEVLAALRRAAVAVVPSVPTYGLVEATSYAALEAMATATPVVVSAVGGLRELVEDGRTGRTVPSGDHEALADAIEWFLRDPERAQRLGAAARAHVEATLASERWADTWVRLLAEATDGP